MAAGECPRRWATVQMRPRLLIADDDKMLVDTMREALEEDFAVETAKDGSEAVKKACEMRPDVVLVDVTMPKLNGYQTCRFLRDQPETADVPIIMVTGHNEPEDAEKAFEAGATDYLTKPFSISQLRARTQTWLMRAAAAG